MLKISQLDAEFDQKHIWHPYTSMLNPLPCYNVQSASGVRLKLDSGEELIDGMSSWWCAIHGYNHPELNKAMEEQLHKMSHVMFGGITHKPAIEVSKILVELTHKELECVFLCDSGSVSVEVALKQAIQYWYALGETKKKKFLTIKNGYHGDTFGAMSVCDPVNSMHSSYNNYVPENIFAEAPKSKFWEKWKEEDIFDFKQKIELNHEMIAAVIIEPILQGAGGMKMYHPKFLQIVRELCDKHKVLLILDEVATGFGRTGKLFAYEHSQIVPDILCVGKAISGGYLNFAAVISTRRVAETICSGKAGCFMHGPTFMGNPMACAVSMKNLQIIQTNEWKSQVKRIENQLMTQLLPLGKRKLAHVSEVRVLGAVGAIEFLHNLDMARCQKELVKLGVWIRPFGKLLYIMPPYIISQDDLKTLIDAMIQISENPPFKN